MSSSVPIQKDDGSDSSLTAPTPVNTPHNAAPIAQGLSRPTVPDIKEEAEDAGDDANALTSALTGMVHHKLSDLLGKSSGYIESLPPSVKRNVSALKGIQLEQVALQNRYKRECLELEKKYLGLAAPLYEKRRAIVSGEVVAPKEDVVKGEEEWKKDDDEYTGLAEDIISATTKEGIPNFWLTALQNHIGLSDVITERDEGALKYLTDITLSYLDSPSTPPPPTGSKNTAAEGEYTYENKPGFTLTFHFASDNPFFTNATLTKTYVYQDEVGYGGDFVYDRAVGCEIEWKEDKDLTKEFEIKKQRNKNTNRTRLVRKSIPTESFFNFFTPPIPPSDSDVDAGKIGEDELEELEEKLEVDYQIGEDIKEKVIPRAIDYFTGKALEYDAMDESSLGSYSEDEDDDDDEGSFDDDDTSDSDVPQRRIRNRRPPKVIGGGAGNSQQVNPEECKQQ